MRKLSLLFITGFFFVAGCATNPILVHESDKDLFSPYQQEGIASWYGKRFHGRKTASGERFNQEAMTCAHRTLPFGAQLKVTNLENNKEVMVTVNDRGPFIKSRIIDLSHAAAKWLEFAHLGVVRVRVQRIM